MAKERVRRGHLLYKNDVVAAIAALKRLDAVEGHEVKDRFKKSIEGSFDMSTDSMRSAVRDALQEGLFGLPKSTLRDLDIDEPEYCGPILDPAHWASFKEAPETE